MSILLYDMEYDKVINSVFLTAKTDYDFAVKNMVTLIDRLEQQRSTLRPIFYKKLEKDIIKGCIMPPLTLAFIDSGEWVNKDLNEISLFVNSKISEGFILDGIQRLNTLRRLHDNNLLVDVKQTVFLNILICDSMDKLLYRMITLNNGQKPMSARHQIEILASNTYEFDDLNLNIQTEKDSKKRRIRGSFEKHDIIKAYIAFISNSVNIDNQKIIESKLDELIVDKIIDSDITERSFEFSDVIDLVSIFINEPYLYNWFKVPNNLIGFAAGISKSFYNVRDESIEGMISSVELFESSFEYFNISKVKIGLARRKAVKYFIEKYLSVKNIELNALTDKLSEVI